MIMNKNTRVVLRYCADAGALALLHRYADLDKAEIIGCIYSSGRVPYGAGIIEAINIYYGRPDIPIGAYYGDEVGDDGESVQYFVEQKEGTDERFADYLNEMIASPLIWGNKKSNDFIGRQPG
jgi:hypothetical protein